MRIDFERTGGVTGMRVATTVDTAKLPEAEAETLHSMLTEAGFFELPAFLKSPEPQMDQFEYRLTVTPDEGDPHTVQMSDAAAPAGMQPLLRKLTLMARNQG